MGEAPLRAASPLTYRLGQRFRRIREEKGISLRVLAAGIRVALFLIRRHEAGSIMLRTDKLIEAANFMGVPASTLIDVEGE